MWSGGYKCDCSGAYVTRVPMRATTIAAARMGAWAVATALHGVVFATMMLSWLWTRVGLAGPPAVLAYWVVTGDKCHLTALERTLHPRGYAVCGRIQAGSKCLVLFFWTAAWTHYAVFG